MGGCANCVTVLNEPIKGFVVRKVWIANYDEVQINCTIIINRLLSNNILSHNIVYETIYYDFQLTCSIIKREMLKFHVYYVHFEKLLMLVIDIVEVL